MVSELLWRAAGASVQGAQHKLSSLPNQDALGWSPDQGESGVLAVSVADGHGYPKGVRADVGAALAVRTALDISEEDMMSLSSRHDAEAFLSKLTEELPALWKERVLADIESCPFEREHIKRLINIYGYTVLDELDRRPEIIYGTTVMLAVCTPGYVMLAQLGDGNILIVDAHGSVSSPIRDDPRLAASQTWSLASPDASSRFRVALLPIAGSSDDGSPAQAMPELIMMATDGYVNSYIDYAGFELVGTDVFKLLSHYGIDALRRQLPGWLESTSEYGSGDDVTAAFIVRTPNDEIAEEYTSRDGSLDAAYSQIPGSTLKGSQAGKPSKIDEANQS